MQLYRNVKKLLFTIYIQGDPKKTEPNSNYSKYTGSVFFGSPCTMAGTYFSAEQMAESIFSVEELSAEIVAPIQLPRPNSTCNDENETPVGLH